MIVQVEALFTIAICTHNRAAYLKLCLDALLSGDVENYPIIVINNGSVDDTEKLLEKYTGRIYVVNEPHIGLSVARNRAVHECSTEYIVFLDDDGIPSPGWVDSIINLTRSKNVDVFGGPYSPYYTTIKPPWFDDIWGSGQSELIDGPQFAPVCFTGANMGWRTSLLREMGGFDPELGIVGTALRLGEETALQIAIRHRHPEARFEFSSAMHILHHVAPEKMTLSYIHRRNFIYGRQLKDIDPATNDKLANFQTFLSCSKLGLPLLWRTLIRDKGKYPYWKTYAAQYLSLNSILLGVQLRRISDAVVNLVGQVIRT